MQAHLKMIIQDDARGARRESLIMKGNRPETAPSSREVRAERRDEGFLSAVRSGARVMTAPLGRDRSENGPGRRDGLGIP